MALAMGLEPMHRGGALSLAVAAHGGTMPPAAAVGVGIASMWVSPAATTFTTP
jgi:hypothetical protein